MASGRMLDHLIAAAPDAFEITLFNAEPRGNYNRLMLSPVLAGEKTYAQIVTHNDAWYAENGVTCRFGERVLSIDPIAKTVTGEAGSVPYDKLVFATGSTPFIIPIQGHDLPGVIAYRDLENTEEMIALASKGENPDGAKAVVIGGGVLGLEAAAGMAARGIDVTVVHNFGHIMNRQLDPEAGALLRADLEARGIKVLCNANSKSIEAGDDGRVRALLLDDGTQSGQELPCDLLVMAVGIRPNIGLAQRTGIAVDRGITVDDQMVTSDPDILALGECVQHRGALFGLVAPLYDQAEVLAKTLLQQPATYVQKELSTKLKVTGCDLFSAGDFEESDARDSIVYRDLERGIYKRLVLEGDRLVGAVIYGDTADGAWFYRQIKDATDISSARSTLVFGEAFATPELSLARSSITGAPEGDIAVATPDASDGALHVSNAGLEPLEGAA